jgi:hypothetical protein
MRGWQSGLFPCKGTGQRCLEASTEHPQETDFPSAQGIAGEGGRLAKCQGRRWRREHTEPRRPHFIYGKMEFYWVVKCMIQII